MACYFRSLMVERGFSPVADIYVYLRPRETGADSRMGESVEGVENLSAHATWDQEPWFSSGYIAEHCSFTGRQGKPIDLETFEFWGHFHKMYKICLKQIYKYSWNYFDIFWSREDYNLFTY